MKTVPPMRSCVISVGASGDAAPYAGPPRSRALRDTLDLGATAPPGSVAARPGACPPHAAPPETPLISTDGSIPAASAGHRTPVHEVVITLKSNHRTTVVPVDAVELTDLPQEVRVASVDIAGAAREGCWR